MKKLISFWIAKLPKKKWAAFCVLFLAALAYCHSSFIFVYEIENGHLSGAMYPMMEESWDHPRLKKLAEDEHLLQVIFPGATEFEKILLLRKWTRSQWNGDGKPFYYPPWDAIEILRLARSYGNKAFCAQYAIVFLQSCLAVGIPARYVDLPGHFVVEIWSNEYNKWVIMDPTRDVHFRKGEDALDGIDLCNAYWRDRWQDIYKVDSNRTPTPIVKEDIAVYRDYSILLHNDQLTLPMVLSVNGQERVMTLEKDYQTYPHLSRDKVGFSANIIGWSQEGQNGQSPGKSRSTDPDDFRFFMNQVVIDVVSKNSENGQIKLAFRGSNSTSFQSFMLMKDDSGIWRESAPNVIYPLAPGVNCISVRVKTRFGRVGKRAYVRIYYKKNWFNNIFANPQDTVLYSKT